MKKIISYLVKLSLTASLILTGCAAVDFTDMGVSPPASYTVSFDSQGATVEASPLIKTVTSPATTVDALPVPPSKTGYAFGGWFTETNGGGTVFDESTTVTANITVYAKWNSYTYTVTFDGQGATVAANPTSKTVTSPATTVGTLPTAPTKTGYTFAGWFTQTNGGGTSFTASTPVAGDITVYAFWSANPVYTVTYNSDGGSAVSPQYVTLPATTVGTLPTAPTKTGYIFGGWYTAPNGGGTAFTASTTVSADITVYAKWNSYTYTVTFDSQGATVAANPTSKTVTSPATTVGTLPTAPTKTGYIFGGWYTAPNGGGSAFDASTTVSGNITVYAKWNSYTYTVTFDSQGATVAANPTSKTVTSPATNVGTLPTAPTKTGYIFGGWYTAPNGGGTSFTASTTVTADITVYAKWNSYTYTVTFDSQGATVAANPTSKTVTSPATTVGTLPSAPTKTGYTFSGWYTAPNGGGTAFTASTTVSADITVYASWSVNPVYTVTYDSDGGSAVSPQYVTLPATTVGTLPTAPTKTGYIFGGWYTAPNGGGTSFTASTTVTADITVYAKWNSYTYTVTFDSQGATVAANPTSKTVTSPATTVGTLPTAPTKTGYIFGGWYTAPNGGGSAFDASTAVSGNITVYAKWNSYTYTVTFDSQGATVAANPTSKTVTSPATTVGTLPTAPTKTGYIFGGWYTAPNGGGSAFDASTTVTGNITVYAKWNSYTYTVTFDSQGATVAANPTSKTVTSPATTVGTLPTAPTKNGYTFGGWYTAPNGGGTVFDASTTVTGNITVYAKWNSYTYTVTFDSQGATVAANPTSKTVTSPATTVGTLPTAPTKTGYIFGGWYTAPNGGGSAFDASTTVTGNITVYAKWNSYTYTVTFDSQGATVAANPTSKTVTSPATTVGTLPTAPTKTGYTFGGWYTAINGGGSAFDASTTVTGNITVYAKWNANTYTVTFDSQGATVPANPTSKTVTSPATTVGTLPTAPTKTGYTFGGWYTAPNGGGSSFTAGTTVTADITVYAKWNANTYTVTFDSQGATVPASPGTKTVTSPATTIDALPTAPTKTGYSFGGWYTAINGGGTVFNESTTVAADITVYAKWVSTTAVGATFGIFSDTVSNCLVYDTDAKIDVWNGMTMADDTTTAGDGTLSWKLTGTAPNGGWMGFGIRVEPLDNYRNLSVFAGGSFKFMFKGLKPFKLGLKSGIGTEAWILPGQLVDYGLVTNNSWCTVSIPVSAFTGLDLSQMQSYLMFAADASTGYRQGDVFNIDNIYFTTNTTPAAKKTYAIYSETYPVSVIWDTDTKMDVWNGFSIAPDSNTSADGAESLKITCASSTWGGMGIRVEPLTSRKDLSAFSGGYLTFRYKSTKLFTKIGIKGGPNVSDERWITGTTCQSSYGLKTDGTWSTVTIPLSAFSGLNLANIEQYFMFVTDGAYHSLGNTYNLDNIYYYK